MLEEDVTVATVEGVLLDLASDKATGCLSVARLDGEVVDLFLKSGELYAVTVPGRRARIGARLISTGRLTPDTLSEALVIQKTELQGWRLGELLVHLGQVERAIVESYVTEQLEDALTGLVGREATAWRWKSGRKTRQDIAPPVAIAEVISRAVARNTRWQHIEAALGGVDVVCHLSRAGTHLDGASLAPRSWALLCRVDGRRTVTELADACGFTLYEAADVVLQLVGLGVVDVPAPTNQTLIVPIVAADEVAQTDLVLPVIASDVADETVITDIPTRAPERVAVPEVRAVDVAPSPATVPAPAAGRHHGRERDDQQTRERADAELVAEQLTQLSEKGAAERAERRRARGETPSEHSPRAAIPLRPSVDQDRQAQLEAELAEAQRLEDERTHRSTPTEPTAGDVQEERAQSRRRRTTAAAEQAAADRAAAERAEIERVAAEQAEAEREAERAEAERAEAEKVAAAEKARAQRIATEKATAAKTEAARIAAEKATAARVEAQRLATEKAAAAKAAAAEAEAERVAAESAEAARVEAERVTAETAAAAQLARDMADAGVLPSAEDLASVASDFADFNEFAEFAGTVSASANADYADGLGDLADISSDMSLGDFARSLGDDFIVAEPAPAPAEVPKPVDVRAGDPPTAETEVAAETETTPQYTDTAALLRELSSLGGFGDDATPAPANVPAPRQMPSQHDKKKKRGLFGR